ncbi:MAG TPA: choice-of-anchor tandem repeat GloVer-containing protein [Terriglobales bacterium]
MHTKRFSVRVFSIAVVGLLSLMAIAGPSAQAQTFTTLHRFAGESGGGNPYAGVIQGSDGTLYGTTYFGGAFPYYGEVYRLDGAGKATRLHSFTHNGTDGLYPYTPLVRDDDGTLYGTTNAGGTGDYGTVFKIDSAGRETVLHEFVGFDGCNPVQGLIRDKSGSLYGTASGCGFGLYGTLFKIDNAGNFKLLHTFEGPPSDGGYPLFGHLTMDALGNIYGTTTQGGSRECGGYGCGTVYKLGDKRGYSILYTFAGGTSDGCTPEGTVLEDSAGNFYGTTRECGSHGDGTIWKLNTNHVETALHSFAGGSSDGCYPYGGVAEDAEGNFYGLTNGCGANNDGALYEFSGGKLSLLHSFDETDGEYPMGEVLRTADGTLFGTAGYGATVNCNGVGCGTVWSYVP